MDLFRIHFWTEHFLAGYFFAWTTFTTILKKEQFYLAWIYHQICIISINNYFGQELIGSVPPSMCSSYVATNLCTSSPFFCSAAFMRFSDTQFGDHSFWISLALSWTMLVRSINLDAFQLNCWINNYANPRSNCSFMLAIQSGLSSGLRGWHICQLGYYSER